jgi:hypothetical protein
VPIQAAYPTLMSGSSKVMELKQNGTDKLIAMILSMEVGKAAPMGLKRVGQYWVPLIPSGVGAAKSLMTKAHMNCLGNSVSPKKCANYIAKAVSMVAPMCPKTGLSLLKRDIEKCISLWKRGKARLFGMMFAKAVINYYKRGRIK